MNCKSCDNGLDKDEEAWEQCNVCRASEIDSYIVETWHGATVIEKAYYVTVAKVQAMVVVFTDLGTAPKWTDIEPSEQLNLELAIQQVHGM